MTSERGPAHASDGRGDDRPARLTLVLGGARSGKSRFAEALIARCAEPWHYIATAQAFDEEMRERIAIHQARRDARWQSHEAPLALPATLAGCDAGAGAVLVDCLTLWLSNVMLDGRDVARESEQLLALLPTLRGPTVLVSNEVGLGIVPENALGRRFRDAQGVLNARVAELADRVEFVAAGLPLTLKPRAG